MARRIDKNSRDRLLPLQQLSDAELDEFIKLKEQQGDTGGQLKRGVIAGARTAGDLFLQRGGLKPPEAPKKESSLDQLVKLNAEQLRQTQEDRAIKKSEQENAKFELEQQKRQLELDKIGAENKRQQTLSEKFKQQQGVVSEPLPVQPAGIPTTASSTQNIAEQEDLTEDIVEAPTETHRATEPQPIVENTTVPPQAEFEVVVKKKSDGTFEEIQQETEASKVRRESFKATQKAEQGLVDKIEEDNLETDQLSREALSQIDISANTFADNALEVFKKSGLRPGVTAGALDKFILTPFNINRIGKGFEGQAPEYGAAIMKNVMKGSRAIRGITLFGKGRPTRWDTMESGIANSAISAKQSLSNWMAKNIDKTDSKGKLLYDLGIRFEDDPIAWVEERRKKLDEFEQEYKFNLFEAIYKKEPLLLEGDTRQLVEARLTAKNSIPLQVGQSGKTSSGLNFTVEE